MLSKSVLEDMLTVAPDPGWTGLVQCRRTTKEGTSGPVGDRFNVLRRPEADIVIVVGRMQALTRSGRRSLFPYIPSEKPLYHGPGTQKESVTCSMWIGTLEIL